MPSAAQALIRYNQDNDFVVDWLDRSHALAKLGAKSSYPFNIPDAHDMVEGWGWDLDRIMGATLIQAVGLMQFMGAEGEKDDLDKRLTSDDFDLLALGLLGWAAVSIVSMDLQAGLLDAISEQFQDADKWRKALANITTYHGWQFVKVYPEDFEDDEPEASTDTTT